MRSRFNEALLLTRRRRFGALASYVTTGITNRSVYDRYLAWVASRRATPLVVRRTRDFELILDLTDRGISKELILYGTREDKLATIFETHTREVCTVAEDPVILDVGANLGYYAVMEANVTEDARLLAIEPVPHNTRLLRANLALNECDDRVSTHTCAIGASDGTAELQFSESSNRHRIRSPRTAPDPSAASMTVPIERLDSFVERQGIRPEDVTVVRMDLEGYEVDVLDGMPEILAGSGPTLLYLEVHPVLLDAADVQAVLGQLREYGFEITAVESGRITWSPLDFTFDVESFEDLEHVQSSYGLIVRK